LARTTYCRIRSIPNSTFEITPDLPQHPIIFSSRKQRNSLLIIRLGHQPRAFVAWSKRRKGQATAAGSSLDNKC
jgi:hypothetical protein